MSCYFPCVRALRSTPCQGEQHRVGKGGRTGAGTDTGTAREGWRGRNGTGNGERGGRRKQGGQCELESKRIPMVEDVSEYWESYKGEGTN